MRSWITPMRSWSGAVVERDEEEREEVADVEPVGVADDLAEVVAAAEVLRHARLRRRKLSSTCLV